MRLGDDKIVACGLEWNEIESKELRRRADSDSNVSLTSGDGPSHFDMRGYDSIVFSNVCRLYSGRAQSLIEQESCPRAFLPIDQYYRRLSQVSGSPNR